MCSFQHRFSSSNTPRIVFHYYLLSFVFNVDNRSGIYSLLLGLWKNEYFVLFTFSKCLFEINDWLILSNWRFAVSKRQLIFLCVRNRLVLSAIMIGSNKVDAFFRSFKNNKNSSGTSIETWGTPHIIVSSPVFSSLFIWMDCFQFNKTLFKHEWFWYVTPYNCSLQYTMKHFDDFKNKQKSAKVYYSESLLSTLYLR